MQTKFPPFFKGGSGGIFISADLFSTLFGNLARPCPEFFKPTANPTPPATPNARRLALEIIGTWQRQNAPGGPAGPFLDDLIAKPWQTIPSLSRPDQALLRELTTGSPALAGPSGLSSSARPPASPCANCIPLVLDLLRLTAYQLLFLDRIPPSAAVHESVKLAKARRLPPALTAFVNAVSRTLAENIHRPASP